METRVIQKCLLQEVGGGRGGGEIQGLESNPWAAGPTAGFFRWGRLLLGREGSFPASAQVLGGREGQEQAFWRGV